MGYVKVLVLSLACIVLISCPGPTSSTDNPHKQEHIPWPSLADSPWPMFHHDPQGTGRSQYSGPQNGEIVTSFNDSFWFESSVIIGENDLLHFVSSGDTCQLYSITDSMEIIWKSVLEIDFEENPAVPIQNNHGTIFIGKQWPTILYAIDAEGNQLWTFKPEEAGISSVTLDKEGNLYFANGNSFVSVTDQGILRWKITEGGAFSGYLPATFSPDGSRLYIGGLDSLYAMSTQGSVIWSYPSGDSKISATSVDNNGNIYFYNPGDSCITSLNSSGQTNWLLTLDEINVQRIWTIPAPTLDIFGNVCFIGKSNSGNLVLVSVTNDGMVNWICDLITTETRSGSISGNIVSDTDGNIYYCTAETLFCISPEGNIQWATSLPAAYDVVAMSIGCSGVLYVALQNSPTRQIIVIE